MEVVLVNTPFAAAHMPSLALTQLKAVTEQQLRGRAHTRVCYLNQDFAVRLGVDQYHAIGQARDHLYSGVGDWLFRQIAFPDAPDNSEEYFRRYYRRGDSATNDFKTLITRERSSLTETLLELISLHRIAEADVVGLTTTFAQTGACLALARLLKELRPEMVIAMGGANCEFPMGLAWLQAPQVDYVFSGSGLRSFPRFLEAQLRGEASKERIPGVFSRSSFLAGELVAYSGPRMAEELPLDVPVPLEYDEFIAGTKARFKPTELRPTLLFETSRGCWWGQKSHCTFCGLNGESMRFRAMPSEQARELITGLFRHAPDCSRFECVDTIMPKEYLRELFPQLKCPPGTYMFYEVKADLSAEDMDVLNKAGVRVVQPGLEALNTSTLKLMRKGTSVFTNLRFLMNCAVHQIKPSWNLLVGFPGEERSVFEKYVADIPLLFHLYPANGPSPVRFDRYSPYFVQASEYGLKLSPLDFYGLTYPFDAETIDQLAYYFADRNYDLPYIDATMSMIGEVTRVVNRWKQRYTGADGGRPAVLHFAQDAGRMVIRDSRDEVARDIPVDDATVAVLEHLSTPRRESEVHEFMSAQRSSRSPRERLSALRDDRVLFVEGDRMMSLVLPHQTRRLGEALTEGPRASYRELPPLAALVDDPGERPIMV